MDQVCCVQVALAWAGRCAKRAGSRLIRLSSHTHAVVMPVDCSNERVSVALDACVLACDMRELADEACKEATPAMPFLCASSSQLCLKATRALLTGHANRELQHMWQLVRGRRQYLHGRHVN